MKCTNCGQTCYMEKYPEVVFINKKENIYICEECSINYEEINGVIQERKE